jgi:hypothetical protein
MHAPVVVVVAATLLASVASASSLQPPVLPLIVRNPYLSTWLQNARDEPWSKWPMFWTGAEVRFLLMAAGCVSMLTPSYRWALGSSPPCQTRKRSFPCLDGPTTLLSVMAKSKLCTRHKDVQLTACPQLYHRIPSVQWGNIRCLDHKPHILPAHALRTCCRQRRGHHSILPLPHHAYVDSEADDTSCILGDICRGPS